jgi:hypothetical protein
MPGWATRRLDDLPRIAAEGEPDWFPLQHVFGLTAFGANLLVADAAHALVEEHDETGSGQEELYLVVAGRAVFRIDGEEVDAPAFSAVAVRDPIVRRSAEARADGTQLLVLGGMPQADFRSTWRPEHFADIDPIL